MATKVSEASITCSICLGRFRKPRILPCLHSYCEDCLLTYAPSGNTSMKCPLCKDEVEVPDGDVTKFKLDFRLQGQVDDATNYDKLAFGATSVVDCNCCDEAQEATSRCLDCEQFLCDFGVKSHQKISGLRGHNVYSLDEIRTGKIAIKSKQTSQRQRMCERHPDEKARYYCHTCHDFICRECVVLDHPRPDHEYTSAADAAKKYKEVVSEKLPPLETVRDEFQAAGSIASSKLRDIEDESEAALKQIRQEAANMRAKIDEAERRLLDDVAKLRRERNDVVQKYKTNFECIRDRASHIHETAKQLIDTGTDDEFLSFYSILNTKIDQLSQEKHEKIEMDGAYISYTPASDLSLDMGKVHVKEFGKWELQQTFGSEGSDLGQFKGALAVTQCKHGNFVVADRDNERVCLFSSEGNHKLTFNTDGLNDDNKLVAPLDLDITPDEEVIITDNSKDVKLFDTKGNFMRKFQGGDKAGVTYKCARVRVLLGNNHQNVGITYSLNGPNILTIHRISDGKLLTSVPLPYRPTALENVDDNHVLITQFQPGQIDIINITDGHVTLTIDVESNGVYKYAGGVCYDPYCCQIYVVTFKHGNLGQGVILQYSRNGVLLGCIAENLLNPCGIRLIERNKIAIADKLSVKLIQKK